MKKLRLTEPCVGHGPYKWRKPDCPEKQEIEKEVCRDEAGEQVSDTKVLGSIPSWGHLKPTWWLAYPNPTSCPFLSFYLGNSSSTTSITFLFPVFGVCPGLSSDHSEVSEIWGTNSFLEMCPPSWKIDTREKHYLFHGWTYSYCSQEGS